ncbi:hypothetical protein [Teichococcus aestuarii]|uniref:Uncharacterized protein n=1 Tax=Teichococcus aestuarii TaxID=568898 RepID=A0A2U1UYP8_9PROT|nr:hypothetical protein [Pseudoroseomonas aestuarii]PWC26789.1 hypothetical protein CR165_21200 [Pseudoroseomonas aestuarii]
MASDMERYQEFVDWLREAGGYKTVEVRRLGRWKGLKQSQAGVQIIEGKMFDEAAAQVWVYDNLGPAIMAFHGWIDKEPEPRGWISHQPSGRRQDRKVFE